MTYKFNVTFETITSESAEHGDSESIGFISEGVSLRDAIEDMGYGSPVESNEWPVINPRWITAYGTDENRSLHFPGNMTPSSKRRLCRLLDVHGA